MLNVQIMRAGTVCGIDKGWIAVIKEGGTQLIVYGSYEDLHFYKRHMNKLTIVDIMKLVKSEDIASYLT